MIITGTIWRCGDDVGVHRMVPQRYLYELNAGELVGHLFEESDCSPTSWRDCIICAGHNFGYGSGSEMAVQALKAGGVQAVLARSFARSFYRAAIGCGLPPVICASLPQGGDRTELARIDLGGGRIRYGGQTYPCSPLPGPLLVIVQRGGLLAYTKNQLDNR